MLIVVRAAAGAGIPVLTTAVIKTAGVATAAMTATFLCAGPTIITGTAR
jgi:hypothetical protein